MPVRCLRGEASIPWCSGSNPHSSTGCCSGRGFPTRSGRSRRHLSARGSTGSDLSGLSLSTGRWPIFWPRRPNPVPRTKSAGLGLHRALPYHYRLLFPIRRWPSQRRDPKLYFRRPSTRHHPNRHSGSATARQNRWRSQASSLPLPSSSASPHYLHSKRKQIA